MFFGGVVQLTGGTGTLMLEVLVWWILIPVHGGDWKPVEGCEMPCCQWRKCRGPYILDELRDWGVLLSLTNGSRCDSAL